MQSHREEKNDGFTIIEILIAVAMAAMILSLGVSWTYLLLAVEDLTTSAIPAAVTFICSFLNVLACAGGIWYFGRSLLPTSPAGDKDEEAASQENRDGL